jgi:hypothetical protein
VVAFAGFAEEYGFDAAAGAKRFFDQAHAFNAHGAGLRGQTAAQRHAKHFEPAIVAAGQDSGRGSRCSVASGLAGGGHQGERSKFRGPEANRAGGKRPDSEGWPYAGFAEEAADVACCGSGEARRARIFASSSNEQRRAE